MRLSVFSAMMVQENLSDVGSYKDGTPSARSARF
jgi:hypothetical protein